MDTAWSLRSSDATVRERRIALCVCASLAVHALVLFLFPDLRAGAPSQAAARTLIARFTQRVPEPSPQLREPVRRSEPPPRRAPVPRPAPQSEMRPPATGAPPAVILTAPETPAAPSPQSPPAVVQSAAVPSPVPAARANRAAPPTSSAADSRPAAPGAETEIDGASVKQFRIALMGAAGRYKRYPVQALERGWQGKVEIRLVIGPGGTIRSSAVTASSGHEILDNQALDMVKRAKPLTPVPAALHGREFSVDIPVIFDLQSG